MISVLLGLGAIVLVAVTLFVTFLYGARPYRMIYWWFRDLKRIDREIYPAFGVWLFSGLGGSGKSIAMVEYASRMKKRYPKLMVVSNMKSLTFSDGLLKDWQDLIKFRNPHGDKYGVLFIFDEIQLTLESGNWKNAPTNVLEYVSQQRKMFKHIIGSSQVFERVNIKLREQTNYVVEVSNIQRRWIFLRAFNKMTYTINGDKKDEGQKKRRRSWKYDFIATDRIRQMFDTYEIQVDLYDGVTKKTVNVDDIMALVNANTTS